MQSLSLGGVRRILMHHTSLLGLFAIERSKLIHQRWLDPIIPQQSHDRRPTPNRHRRLANANRVRS
jgi:hypothetical protein